MDYVRRDCHRALMPILVERQGLTSAPVSRPRHLGYQLRRALRARRMSNSAINPPLVVIRALASGLGLEIYDFILRVRKLLIIDDAKRFSKYLFISLSVRPQAGRLVSPIY